MVGIVQKAHEEILVHSDDLPQLLGEPDVEDRVVQLLACAVILQDLQPPAGLQLREETIGDPIVVQSKGDRELARMLSLVIEVQERDVRARPGRMVEELEEHARLIRQIYRELKEPECS